MLKVGDITEVARGIGDKSFGIAYEFAGTVSGNERLKEAGRRRQQAGDERLKAFEEETKATARAGEAKAQEIRQKAYQSPENRSEGRDFTDQDSAGSAAAEKLKGVAKKGFATVTGNENMKAEAEAQKDKADEQAQAAKHSAKAEVHRKKADAEAKMSDAARRSS